MVMFIYVLWFEAYTIVQENLRKSLMIKKSNEKPQIEHEKGQRSIKVTTQNTQ